MDEHNGALDDHERGVASNNKAEWPDWIKGVWNEDTGDYRHLREKYDRNGHVPRSISKGIRAGADKRRIGWRSRDDGV